MQRAKQEEEELRRPPEAGPPEATEAWFLSRSPAGGGRQSPSLSGLSVLGQQAPMRQNASQLQHRQTSYSSRESVNSGALLASFDAALAGKTVKGE